MYTDDQPSSEHLPIAGIVLASGLSRRFVGGNKLLALVGGVPVVRRTVQAYVDAGLDPVVVVVGHEAHEVGKALAGLRVVALFNPDFAHGQSRALVRGVRHVSPVADAAVVGVGDQPFLVPTIIRDLIGQYRRERAPLVVPRYGGQRGNPVLFDRDLFAELLQVEGDVGGRPVVERHRDEIIWLDVPDARAGADLDTRDQYAALAREDEA